MGSEILFSLLHSITDNGAINLLSFSRYALWFNGIRPFTVVQLRTLEKRNHHMNKVISIHAGAPAVYRYSYRPINHRFAFARRIYT